VAFFFSFIFDILWLSVGKEKQKMKPAVISMVLFVFTVNPAFSSTDLCEYAKETPHMTNINFEQFFEDKLRGNSFSGKGVVTNVRSNAPSEYIVVVDCRNGVVANVIVYSYSSSVKDLKIGDRVEFSGKCVYGFRRNTRQYFELHDGDVK